MKVSLHVNFDGQCEEAFKFYEARLNGVMGALFRYADSPMAKDMPSEWQQKIVHANLSIGNMQITGADVLPEHFKTPQGFSLLLGLPSEDEVKSTFERLRVDGQITLPLQRTFWSPCYGIVVDKFGVPWELNCST